MLSEKTYIFIIFILFIAFCIVLEKLIESAEKNKKLEQENRRMKTDLQNWQQSLSHLMKYKEVRVRD